MSDLQGFIEGFRAEEPGFLNYASYGPLSAAVLGEQSAWSAAVATSRPGSLPELFGAEDRAREAMAELLGFRVDQVAVQPNTSMGLMHAMFGLSGEVLVSPAEFPSLPFAAVRAGDALDAVIPVWLETPDGRVTPERVREQLTSDITAVAVSLVDPRTGYLVDLEALRDVVGDRILVVDAIQGAGVVDAPLALADVVVGGGQKWLRAGWGTGYLALSDRALDELEPVISGFRGIADSPEIVWDDVLPPTRGASAYRVSNPDWIACARLHTAAQEIAQAGVANIADEIALHVTRIIDLADEFAVQIGSPRNERERAGIVILEPTAGELSALTAALFNHGVSATAREGRIRLAAHAGTTEETLEMLRAAFTSYASTVPTYR